MKPIPVSAAKGIANSYGYDQVVIVARKVGEDPDPHGEHVTTYGVDEANCDVAARIGAMLKHRLMRWPVEEAEIVETVALALLREDNGAFAGWNAASASERIHYTRLAQAAIRAFARPDAKS